MKNDISKEIDLNAILEGPQESVPQQVQEASAEVLADFAEIVEEWSYRLPKGYPTAVDGVFTERAEVEILNKLLEERGLQPLPLPEANIQIIKEATTEDNSEVLCMYYSCVDKSVIQDSKEYLTTFKKVQGKPKKPLKMLSGLTGKNLGASGVTALQNLMNDYNAGKPNIKVFVNAITCGELIQLKYGSKIPANQVDRGENFDKLKKDAILLAQSSMGIKLDAPDKWSPADIMIYNKSAPRDLKKYKNLIDVNKLFTKSISSESGKIVGISLKQASAQGGKALSFKKALTRSESFETAEDLSEDDKIIRSGLYLSQATKSDAKSGKTIIKDSDKIGYIAEIAVTKRQVKDPNIQEAFNKLSQEAKMILVKTFGKDGTKELLSLSQSAVKDKARTSFGKLKNPTIGYTKNYDALVSSYNKSAKARATKLYNDSRKAFVDALGKKNYSIKEKNDVGGGEEIGSSLLIRKASCYTLATWLLTGMAKGGLKIPSGFASLAKEKNPFIALTAYAIGYAGVSPYFIKVLGAGDTVSNLSQSAKSHEMGGDGMLVTQKNQKIEILDSKAYAGFQAHLLLTTHGGSVSYDVTLDFRFAGSQINIEVSKIQ